MTPKEKDKIYHIYAKNKCIFPNIKEEEFRVTWNTLKGMVGLMQTDYTLEDLSYEEVERSPYTTEENSYQILTTYTYYDIIDLKVIQNYG